MVQNTMGLNPFGTVTSYSAMLNKIAVFTFVVGVALTWVWRTNVPGIAEFLSNFDFGVVVAGNPIKAGYLLPALLVALLFRVVKMHDRISDALGTRREFDLNEILVPLSIGAQVPLTTTQRDRALEQRDPLMYKVFYAYASGTEGKSKIDSHYVTMAMDQWSWFWIGTEAIVLIGASGVALALEGHHKVANWAFAVCFLILLLQHFTRRRRARYAHAQVDAIVGNAVWRNEVAGHFRAL